MNIANSYYKIMTTWVTTW